MRGEELSESEAEEMNDIAADLGIDEGIDSVPPPIVAAPSDLTAVDVGKDSVSDHAPVTTTPLAGPSGQEQPAEAEEQPGKIIARGTGVERCESMTGKV